MQVALQLRDVFGAELEIYLGILCGVNVEGGGSEANVTEQLNRFGLLVCTGGTFLSSRRPSHLKHAELFHSTHTFCALLLMPRTSSLKRSRDAAEEQHECTHCGRAFSRKDHLTRHLLSHSSERPFACTVCGKAFARG